MPRLSEEKRSAMMREYGDGESVAVLASRYGVSENYPCQLAKRYGVRRRAKLRGHASEAEAQRASIADSLIDEIAKPAGPAPAHVNTVAEIRRLFRLGRKRTEIAALLRCRYREVEAALA